MEKLKAKKLEKKGIVFRTKEEKRKEKRLKEKEKRQKKKRRLYKQQEKEQEFDDFSDKVSFFLGLVGHPFHTGLLMICRTEVHPICHPPPFPANLDPIPDPRGKL